MTGVLKWARNLMRRTPLAPLRFPTSGYQTIQDPVLLEEENLDGFNAEEYYPVNIGDVYASGYQVVGKLGFGTTSTAWLARNLASHGFVTLKVYTRRYGNREEFQFLEAISTANPSHPGYRNVRRALDIFELQQPKGNHYCLVQEPMWESLRQLLLRNPSQRFPPDLLKATLRHLFAALDYLHSECKLVHTDIKADNILQQVLDKRILEAFVDDEFAQPSARKFNQDATIYASRTFDLPRRFGEPVLADFGAAVRGDVQRNHDAQPAIYRAPEVMLMTDWSYAVDIWNVGTMIWDLFEGRHLFNGNDPDYDDEYRTRAHLAEVIAVLGPPPVDLLHRGKRSREFFSEDGTWIADFTIPPATKLEDCESFLEGESKAGFMNLVRGMLQWRPEDRKTAAELTRDPWLNLPDDD